MRKFSTAKKIMSVMLLLAMMISVFPVVNVFAADNYINLSKSGWTKLVTKEWPSENGTGEKLFDGSTGAPHWQANGAASGDFCGAWLPSAQKVNRITYLTSPRYTPPTMGVYVTSDKEKWIRVGGFDVPSSEQDFVEIVFDFPKTMEIIGFKLQAESSIDWWSSSEITLSYNPYVETEINYEDVKGAKYEDEISLTSILGITKGISDEKFGVDETCTRFDFAEWMLNYAGIPVSKYDGEAVYLDVSPEHWSYDTIYTCYTAGIIRAAGTNAKFRADDAITYGEAVSMIMAVLGYSKVIDEAGGYPAGCFAMATKAGLLQGMNFDIDDKLTRAELAKLVYNSLSVKPLVISEYSSEGYMLNVDRAEMLERMEVTKARGVVQANETTMLNNPDSVGDGTVMINDELFRAGGSDAAEYLGYLVDYWYRNVNGVKTILYAKISDKMDKPVKIDADDIAPQTSLSQIVYYDSESGKEKTLRVSERCNFIFNGVANPYVNVDDIKPENGSIEAIDSDSDGVVDVVKIDSKLTFVVETASGNDMLIIDKHTGEAISLKGFTDNNIKVIDTVMDIEVAFSAIGSGSVLSIAPDRMKTVNGKRVVDAENMSRVVIYVSKEQKTGKIEKIVSEYGKNYYVIDGEKYSVDSCIADSVDSLKIGSAYTFSLTYDGVIADFNQDMGGNQYGILMGVAKEGVLTEHLNVRIYTQGGSVSLFTVDKKALLGTERKSVDVIYDSLRAYLDSCISLNLPSLVMYRADANNVIKFINVANNEAAVITDSERESTDVQLAYSGVYKYANGCFGNIFFTDSTTIGFSIAADVSGKLDLTNNEALSKRNATSFGWNTGFQIYAYNLSDTYVPDVLCVMEVSGGSSDTTGAMCVFREIYSVYDVNTGETTRYVSTYCKGNVQEYKVAKNATFDFSDLNLGDCGFAMTNPKGEMLGFDRRFSGNRNWDNATAENVDVDAVESSLRYAAGKVLKKVGDFVVVDVSKTTEDGVYDGSKTAIFKGVGKVCILEDGELWVSKASDISIGDNIFIRNCYGQVFDVVIFK